MYPDLVNYINSQLKLGFDETVLREKILSKGWNQSQVDETFNQIKLLTNTSPEAKEATQNTSGMKDASTVPEEIKGWSWAAFLMTWIWAIGNHVWVGLLTLLPVVGFAMQIVLGLKGKEWAWKNKHWESVEQFNAAQKKWIKWGLIFSVIGIILMIGAFVISLLTVSPQKQLQKANCVKSCNESDNSQVCIDECVSGESQVVIQNETQVETKKSGCGDVCTGTDKQACEECISNQLKMMKE
jgi:hypothetical protein